VTIALQQQESTQPQGQAPVRQGLQVKVQQGLQVEVQAGSGGNNK
jgi:hypothetical protein